MAKEKRIDVPPTPDSLELDWVEERMTEIGIEDEYHPGMSLAEALASIDGPLARLFGQGVDKPSLEVQQAARDELDAKFGPPTQYIVERLLPKGRVNLIGGPSGSGKTTLVFQLFEALSKNEPFLGRKTTPVNWGYISGDRSAESVHETMRRVEVHFPVFSLVDNDLVGQDLITKIIPRLRAVIGHTPDFLYIDGFTALTPQGKINDYAITAKWLAQLARYCARFKVTILGACHTTKTKQNEMFTNARQKIAGSVAWAGFSESVIMIEPPEKFPRGSDGSERMITFLPRNYPQEVLEARFNSKGRIELVEEEAEEDELIKPTRQLKMDAIAQGMMFDKNPGDVLEYAILKAFAMGAGASRSSFDKWVKAQVDIGYFQRADKGEYLYVRKIGSNPDAKEELSIEKNEGTEGEARQTIQ